MRVTKRRHHELIELRAFFRSWFGEQWDLKLRLRAGTYHRQLDRVIAGNEPLADDLLARLRRVRWHLQRTAACDVRSA